MRKDMLICPSTDPVGVNEEELIKYAQELENLGADFLHCDIMKDNFVKKNTIDFKAVKTINNNTTIPLDVHLMTEYNKKEVNKFISSKANIITLHIENFIKNNKLKLNKLKKVAKLIKNNDCLFGISIKPNTNLKFLTEVLGLVNLVLVMSVEPGESGQKFLEESFNRVKEIDILRSEQKLNFLIEVDGGINAEISQKLKKLNVDMIVSGNYIYKSENRAEAIKSLR